MRFKNWQAFLLLSAAAATLFYGNAFPVEELSSADKRILRSAQPGASQGHSTSSNHRLRQTAGEISASTLTSTNYYHYPGAQYLMSWPGAVTSLSALTGQNSNEIRVTWTAPGADGTVDRAASYLIKYRIAGPFETDADFDEAFLSYLSTRAPLSPGSFESHVVTGLSAGPTYYFAVVAVDSFTARGYLSNTASAWASGPPDLVPPNRISDLTALTGDLDGRVFLNWTSPGDDDSSEDLNAGRYRIHGSTSPFFYLSSTHAADQFGAADFDVQIVTNGVAPGTKVGYVAEGLNPDTTYYFGILARDDSNNWNSYVRGAVNRLSSAPARDLPLAEPADAAVSAVSTRSFTASWTAPPAPDNVDDRASYRLYVATSDFSSPGQGWVHLSSEVTHPLASGATAQLQVNTTYFFAVTAVDSGTVTNGLYSQARESAVTAVYSTPTLAAAPSGSAFSSVNRTSATLSWSAGANPVSPPTLYEVQFSTASNFGVYSASFTYLTSASTASLAQNATYYARARALNRGGIPSAFDGTVSTATLAAAPGFAGFAVQTASVTVNLQANFNAVGTRIEISSGNFDTSNSSAGVLAAGATPLSLLNLTPNATYAIFARAVNYQMLPSSSLAVIAATVTLPAVPLDPDFETPPAEVNFTSITLQWNPNGNPLTPPTSYEMQISTWDGFAGTVTSSVTFNTFASTSGLASDTSYYFRVRAFGKGNTNSAYASVLSTYTLDNVAPRAITSLSALTGDEGGEVRLHWIAPGDNGSVGQAARYEIKRAVPPFNWPANYDDSAVLVTNSLPAGDPGALEEYVVQGLTSGSTYAFVVRAFDEAGNQGALSNGATTWAKLRDNSTFYYITVNSVSDPDSARGLSLSSGTGSNNVTRVTPTTNNNYYVIQPIANVTGTGAASLPAATTTFGWVYDASLAGLSVDDGVWSLRLKYRVSAVTLVGRLYYRINRVTVSQFDTTLKSHLTQGTNGWVQWGSGNLANTTVFVTTLAATTVAETYFEAGDRLMVEFAYQPTGGSNGSRSFYFEVNDDTSVIRTSNILDQTPPNAVTTLTGLYGNFSEGDVSLAWLAPGDDGTNGTASYYDIRYTDDPAFNWGASFESAGIWKSNRPVGGASGASEAELISATGLTGGVTYYFVLRSYDEAGNSALSYGATQWAMPDLIPPGNISDLTALLSGTEASVNLQWTAPGDNYGSGTLGEGSGYRIRASTEPFTFYSSSSPAWASADVEMFIATSSVNPGDRQGHLLTGLNPGTTWYVGIYAVDDRGNGSVWNRTAVFNTRNSTSALDLALSPPSGIASASVSSTSVVISWTLPPAPEQVDDRGGYRLYAATSAFTFTSESWVKISSQVAHPLAQAATSQILPNRFYYARVSALDLGDQGGGLYSAALESSLSALLSTCTLAEIPGGLEISEVNRSSVTLAWTQGENPASPLTLYQLHASTDSNFGAGSSSATFELGASSVTLALNTTYYFKARALNQLSVPTGFSPALSTVTLAGPVTLNAPNWAPADVSVTASTARWNANGNPPGTLYRVEFATSSDFEGIVTASQTYQTFASTSGLLGGTTVVFRVQAVNHRDLPADLSVSVATATLPGTVSLNAPNWATADVGIYAATAAWSAGGNAPGVVYHVEFATSASFVGATLTSSDTANLFVSTAGLLGNTTIAFRVRAVSPQGPVGNFATSAATSTLAEAGVFGSFAAADAGSSSQTVSWTAPGNKAGTLYRVRVSTQSNFAAYATSQTYVLQVTTAGLRSNTTYYYRGFAVNNRGLETAFLAELSTPTRANPPATAASTFTSVAPNDITAQWSANNNTAVTLYNVYVATASNFSGPLITTIPVQTVNVTTSGLTENTSYFFRVSAVNHQGFETAAIPIGSTLTPVSTDFTPPRNVSDLTALTGTIDGQVQINWTSPGDDLASGALNNGRYRIRYSSTPFTHFSSTYADLSGLAATIGLGDVAVSTTGVSPGTRVGALINGLNPGTTYFFGVIARDDSSNWSFFSKQGTVNRLSSAPARDLTLSAPSAPALVSISSTSAQISWTAPSAPANIDDRDVYRLYAATANFTSAASSWVNLASAAAHPLASATTEQLTPNTSYMFKIAAVDFGDRGSGLFSAALESALSVAVTTFTRAQIPGDLAAVSVHKSSFTLSWAPGSNPLTPPTSYQVQVSTAENFGAFSSSVTFRVDVASLTLQPNATYFARARAYNRVGLPTEFGPVFSTATLASTVTLNAPNWAAADVGIGISTARWNANGNPSGTLYRVQFATSIAFAGTVTSSETYLTMASTQGLLGNTTLAFRVEAVNWQGRGSGYIASLATATLLDVPLEGAPTSFVDVWYTSAGVSWTPNNAQPATQYEVEISTAINFTGLGDLSSGWGIFNSSTHTFTGLTAEATYFAQVRARNSQNRETAYRFLGTTVALDNASPGAVTALSALTGATEGILHLSWVPPGDNGYSGPLRSGSRFHIASTTVQGSALNPAFWSTAVRDSADLQISTADVFPGTTQSITLTDLGAGVTHYFRIWTRDEAGNWSGELSVGATAWAQQDVTPPDAPSDLLAVAGSTTPSIYVNLFWTMPGDDGQVGNIAGGTVTVKYRTEGQGGDFVPAQFDSVRSTFTFFHSSAQGTAFFVPITGLMSEATYYFAVKLKDERGNLSEASNTTFAVSPDTVTPNAITTLSALTGVDGGTVRLTWTAPGDNGTTGQAASYEIKREIPPVDWPSGYDSAVLVAANLPAGEQGSVEEYIVQGLTPGSTYAFIVRALDEAGNRAALSRAATTWAALPNDTTTFYLRNLTASDPDEAKTLTIGPGSGSNTSTRITPTTNNNYYILQPLATVTGSGAASLPTPTTTFGWIYDQSLAGLTIEAGNWTLRGRYEMSATTLVGTLHFRINRVTVTPSSTTVKSFLTQGTDGWVQWGSAAFPNFTTLTTTVAVTPIQETYFEPEDRLMIEFAFRPTAGSNGTRRFHWEVNDSSNVIRTTNINDPSAPSGITTLVALGTSAYLNEGQVRLEWLAPGGDGTNGQAAYYDVRYAEDPAFNWSTSFESASIWKSSRPVGGSFGLAETELIAATGLIGGVTYYFAIKTYDNAGNASLSNVAMAQAAFDEVALVIVGTDTYNFGLVNMGAAAVSSSSFTIRNAGNVLHDYRLRATTMTANSPWSLDVTSGTDRMILFGAFSDSPPALEDFGPEDVILYSNLMSDETRYSVGPSSGASVPWNDDRHLWLKINMPLLTSTTDQQRIRVSITGTKSP